MGAAGGVDGISTVSVAPSGGVNCSSGSPSVSTVHVAYTPPFGNFSARTVPWEMSTKNACAGARSATRPRGPWRSFRQTRRDRRDLVARDRWIGRVDDRHRLVDRAPLPSNDVLDQHRPFAEPLCLGRGPPAAVRSFMLVREQALNGAGASALP